MRAEKHTACWKGREGGCFFFSGLHFFVWPVHRRGTLVQLFMGQECITICLPLVLTMPWVVSSSPPSKLTCHHEVGVLGWDHASLDDATLAVRDDAV